MRVADVVTLKRLRFAAYFYSMKSIYSYTCHNYVTNSHVTFHAESLNSVRRSDPIHQISSALKRDTDDGTWESDTLLTALVRAPQQVKKGCL